MQTKLKIQLFLLTIFIGFSTASFASAVCPVANKRFARLLLLFVLPMTMFFVFAPSKAFGATAIYRSVGPSATTALETGTGNDLTISSSTATFDEPIADNIGVGDAIQYDDDSDGDIDSSDSIAFITSRISNTQYTITNASGGTPTAVTDDEDWSIFRAYTSLSLAETGTENTGIDSDLRNFDTFTTGKNITSSDEEWNIACYANGTTADTTMMDIYQWTTDSDNFIKVYTPFEEEEVGESQRHEGVWDDNKFKIEIDTASSWAIRTLTTHVRIEGLQIFMDTNADSAALELQFNSSASNSEHWVSDNIIKKDNSSINDAGIFFRNNSTSSVTSTLYAYNNIIYGFDNTNDEGIFVGSGTGATTTAYVYNNTIYDCNNGIYRSSTNSPTVVAKNNILQSTSSDFSGTFSSASINNITEVDAQDGAFGASADSGNTDGITTATNVLRDTGQNFLSTVKVGMVVANTTDSTYTYVSGVNSNTELDVNDDYFDDSEDYTIYTNMYGSVTFENEGSDDFHLGTGDILAANKGTDLSSDSNLAFSTDIDEHTRAVQWDIGADQLTPTEFTSIIDPDNDTGTDYTSLNSWESNNQVDLTSAATKVFSGAITTGSLSDTGTVTLYRGGSSLGITANVVHATSTQLMVDTISNTSVGFEISDQWRINSANYFTITDVGDSATSVAECRSTDGTADTNDVTIDGWTTSATNYIKVWTDPTDAYGRHNGVWDERKYHLSVSSASDDALATSENYVIIEGLQVELTGSSDYVYGIVVDGENTVANNIVRKNSSHTGDDLAGITVWPDAGEKGYAYNNIVYGFDSTDGDGNETCMQGGNTSNGYIHFFNNTISDCNIGFDTEYQDTVLKNNIAQNCTNGYNGSSDEFYSTSDYNISDLASDAPGSNSKNSTSVSFEDESGDDFHLSSSDTAAQDAGTDLSTDPNLNFTDDVDGVDRVDGDWDIGADEAPIQIFRSVGPSQTGDLGLGSSNDLTISGSTATFDSALGNDVGVGDAIQYDDDGDSDIDSDDSIVFITARTSSTVFTVKNADGTEPTAVTDDNNWSIFRAYTSLFNAESGDENDSIDDDLEDFDSWSGGKDIVATNEQWNIAAYANGTTQDTTNVTIDGWTTGANNYLKVYTPTEEAEVGESQRHSGKWDSNKYSQNSSTSIESDEEFVWFEGLQIENDGTGTYAAGIAFGADFGIQKASNNIIRCTGGCGTGYRGIRMAGASDNPDVYIWNNIIYGFDNTSNGAGIDKDSGPGVDVYIFNNTVFDCWRGIRENVSQVYAKNNIVQDCGTGGCLVSIEDGTNNITDEDAEDGAFGDTHSTGTADTDTANHLVNVGETFISDGVQVGSIVKNTTDTTYGYVTAVGSETDLTLDSDIFPDGDENYEVYTNKYGSVAFENETNDDFHLAETDTLAKNQGTDLSTDDDLAFSDDIDGGSRDQDSAGWDIGADEGATQIFRSVGATNVSALETGSGNDLTISGSTASFDNALADNVGVGDAIQYDDDSDSDIDANDSIVFVTGRTSSTVFTVKNADGTTPTAVTDDEDWSIFRAYTSLSNAETGTENTGIDDDLENFDSWSGGKDLTTNNEQWNIAAYGDAVDNPSNGTNTEVDGWTTGDTNYLKIFTPFETSKVGAPQRHTGKWTEGRYTLKATGNGSSAYALVIENGYVRVDGLQILVDCEDCIGSNRNGVGIDASVEEGTLYLTNNVIKAENIEVADGGAGISYVPGTNWGGNETLYAFGNIIYDFRSGDSTDFKGIVKAHRDASVNIENNTVFNCGVGYSREGDHNDMVIKNSIAQDTYTGFLLVSSAASDYNISDDATAPGTNSKDDTTVAFFDETDDDFHLASADTAAVDAGDELSTVFSDDIDGQLRTDWDIGADEAAIEFDPTVMASGGDYSSLSSWESNMQTDLTADTTRVFAHGGITGTIADTDSVTGATSSATADVVHATDNGAGERQILLENISGTFQDGEQVQVDGSNHVTISDDGNPAIAVAKIDGAWASAEGNQIVIDGWTTGPTNNIKIFTTPSTRHDGIWSDSAYRLEYNGDVFKNKVGHIVIDGLQVDIAPSSAGTYREGIANLFDHRFTIQEITISNNIVKQSNITTNNSAIFIFASTETSSESKTVKLFNNLVYDFSGASSNSIYATDGSGVSTFYYNNTVHNCYECFFMSNGSPLAKNNIASDCGNECFTAVGEAGSSNNISSDSTAPGTDAITGHSVLFADESGDDFHLSSDEERAIDFGTDLSSDSALNFSTDIDGDDRPSDGWDIGADEAPVKIFRSVGPSQTSALDDDNSGADTLTISGSTATFSAAIADNVGVGDALVYDDDADDDIDSDDSIVFIHKRNSDRSFTIKDEEGEWPAMTVTAEDDWEIYRAHTSLANAEAGTENSSLTTLGFSFTGGNRDLVAGNEQWNIACYADAEDSASDMQISGWTTDAGSYLKIYTPFKTSEVGTSQRHNGKADTGYGIQASASNMTVIRQIDAFVRFEGLRIVGDGNNRSGLRTNTTDVIDLYVSDCMIYDNSGGIDVLTMGAGSNAYIWNNIIFDNLEGIDGSYGTVGLDYFIYNNTVVDNSTAGIRIVDSAEDKDVYMYNNICNGNTTDYDVTNFDTYNHSNNIAEDTSSPDDSFDSTAVTFVDETGDNFHLSASDASAQNQAADLSADSNLSFDSDIDGEARPYGASWDIGADEATKTNVRIRGGVQIDGGVLIDHSP